MRTNVFPLIVLAALVTASGCGRIVVTTKQSTGLDLAKLASYDWATNDSAETGEVLLDDSGLGPTLRDAIAEELSRKNYARVASDRADFFVRYHASVEHRVDEMDLNAAQTDRAGWWGPRDDEGYVVEPGVTGQYVHEYDEGSVVIDFVEPKTTRILYRMRADTRLHLYTVDAEERRHRVGKVVRRMMKNLPSH